LGRPPVGPNGAVFQSKLYRYSEIFPAPLAIEVAHSCSEVMRFISRLFHILLALPRTIACTRHFVIAVTLRWPALG